MFKSNHNSTKNLILVIIVFISFKSAAQVTSVTGTANQVIASGSTGAITLSLPQSIGTTSTPRFSKMTLGPTTSNSTLYMSAPLTGGITSAGSYVNCKIASDVTLIGYGYLSIMATQDESFTLSNMKHFTAAGGAAGSGSTIVTQIGFEASATLAGATNNYGFVGKLPAAAGKWNLFMSGTASNYLAGNLGIGTTDPTEKLSVNGNIRAKEIRVEASPWPDYVFHKSYSLQPLSEVEKFIAANQHLPGIPSASEIEKDGLNLGEMDARLLKKIEELTLYVISLKKELDELKSGQVMK